MKTGESLAPESSAALTPDSRSSSVRHLYVHVPFCPKVCPYCSFYKQAGDHSQAQPYLDAVLRDFECALKKIPVLPQTVFFGGGTPTALRAEQLDFLISGLKSLADFSQVEEWTIETNPATVSGEKAQMLRQLGVNRISMGVQSWDPQLLQVLGRVHSVEQAEESYDIYRQAGFEAINLDHIFAIPGQHIRQWQETLTRTIALRPEHISAYCLTYEEDTEFMNRYRSGEFKTSDERDVEYFEVTMRELEESGYNQYETSNYALPGFECRHNLAYWHGAEYLGLGPSAFSTVGNYRWQAVADTNRYIDAISRGDSAIGFREELSAEILLRERIAFGLRTSRGIPISLLDNHQDEVSRLLDQELLRVAGDNLVVTASGKLLVDAIAESLI